MQASWALNGPKAALLYIALAILSFIPQSFAPHDTVAYAGDSLESVYLVAWNVHAAFGEAALFEANVLHPLGSALAFTDHRLLPSLAVAPVVWATGNPVLAYNVAVLFATLLAAFGARHLARTLGLPPWPAWVAGALYAFHTYQINEAPRLHIIAHGFLPFAITELIRYLEKGERRHAFTAAGLMLLQGLASNYHLLYGSLLIALVAALFLIRKPASTLRRLPWLLLAAGAAALLFTPIALTYLRAAEAHDYTRELPRGVDIAHFMSTTPTNWIYGAIGVDVRLQQQGPHFVGFVSLALAALACLGWLRRWGRANSERGLLSPRVWVPGAAVLAVIFFSLALGRDVDVFGLHLGPGPYRLLYAFVPGFQLVRIPERLALLAMLFVALLAARGLALAGARAPRLALALGLLVPLEHVSPLPLSERVPVGDTVPTVYSFLAQTPVSAVAELPVRGEGLVREETYEMYFSAYHFRPLVGGYTAFPSLLTTVLRRFAAEFPAEVALQALTRVGVDTVVVHHGRPVGVDLRHQLHALGPAHEDEWGPLLRRARLDLFERLPAAVNAGRLERLAVFPPPFFQSDRDEAYLIVPGSEQIKSAAMPRGSRRLDPRWRYRTKEGDAALAIDGDMRTGWTVSRPLKGDEFFEVVFDHPIPVAGLVLRLGRDSMFPTRFRIGAQDLEGRWGEVARYDDAHALQLLDSLLNAGDDAAIGFDLGAREVRGLNILVEAGGTSYFGWKVPEIEVLVP